MQFSSFPCMYQICCLWLSRKIGIIPMKLGRLDTLFHTNILLIKCKVCTEKNICQGFDSADHATLARYIQSRPKVVFSLYRPIKLSQLTHYYRPQAKEEITQVTPTFLRHVAHWKTCEFLLNCFHILTISFWTIKLPFIILVFAHCATEVYFSTRHFQNDHVCLF